MHIHGAIQSVQGPSYASIASQRQAAANQAAEVRKRLLKRAQTPGGDTTPEESLMIEQWFSTGEVYTRHSPTLEGDEYHSTPLGRDPNFD